MSAITLEQTEIELLEVKLQIAKVQKAQSFARGSGNSTVSATRANLDLLYKERDRLQVLFDRLAGPGGIRCRGAEFL